MNKQFLRRLSLIILPLLVVVTATYFLITSNVKEVKAYVNIDNAFDFFASYNTWPNSATRKTGTAAEWLHTMAQSPNALVSNIDINGDGLVDILLHQDQVAPEQNATHWYGVLLNRGDLKFDLAYKCVTKYTNLIPYFYGDCAQ